MFTSTNSCVPVCIMHDKRDMKTPKVIHFIFPELLKCPNTNATASPEISFDMRIKPEIGGESLKSEVLLLF